MTPVCPCPSDPSVLHARFLEPDLDLALSKVQQVGHLHPAAGTGSG